MHWALCCCLQSSQGCTPAAIRKALQQIIATKLCNMQQVLVIDVVPSALVLAGSL